MATNLECPDEDYIDMELCSSSSLNFVNSSQKCRDFEFQMSSICREKDTTTSPADELFYKGKLLPLHLPPRLQMVQTLLSTTSGDGAAIKEGSFPFISSCSTAPCTNTNTPLDSCNITPSESCRVSCELNPDDYFFEWSTELSSFIKNNYNHHPKKSWTSKKLKFIKHSILGSKLKASRAYLKSLFSKSAHSEAEILSKNENFSNKYFKVAKKNPTIGSIINIEKEGIEDNVHRRSFSSAIKRHSPTKCLSSYSSNSSSSSSSFSYNLNNGHELNFLKRSSSAPENESSIEAAIAHCKKSRQLPDSRNASSDSAFCTFSDSKIADGEDREKSSFVLAGPSLFGYK
ncbi:unnamed protein product [Fraxinus pennsylvanica]|uniref:Membrane-associated kinase regulator 4 n=1 Tax=Fraxinus pennsylvanica TaxID=56036 RepID=A0AAD2E7G5_9LAMI|nr:unnamed protein product [Fraxinus pennsylvanica]